MVDPEAVTIPEAQRARVALVEGVWAAVKRRYQEIPASFWIGFDLLFGIAVPIACLVLDRGLFRPNSDDASLTRVQVSVYGFVAIEIVALILCLLPRRPSSIVAGALAAGATFATCVAVVVFPVSLFLALRGLVEVLASPHEWATFDVGSAGYLVFAVACLSLGLSTALVAWVYARRGWCSLQQMIHHGTPARTAGLAAAGVLLSLAGPAAAHTLVQIAAERATEQFVDGTAEDASARARLSRMRRFIDVEGLMREFEIETDPVRKVGLERAYFAITGESVAFTRERTSD